MLCQWRPCAGLNGAQRGDTVNKLISGAVSEKWENVIWLTNCGVMNMALCLIT